MNAGKPAKKHEHIGFAIYDDQFIYLKDRVGSTLSAESDERRDPRSERL